MKKKQVLLPESDLSLPLRRYLYLSAAVTGAAIMIIEILGAKMLAPYVGTSHFVWTAQIAVTLVALSLGYYAGGRLVDRAPRLSRLFACVLLAGVYLAFTVVVVEPVAYWCLQYKLALGSLLASAFLFLIPLAMLAMVGPFFVRVLTRSVQNVGGTIGRLTAISTLGSVVGTILIGYVMIPLLPNSTTMYFTATALMIVSAVYFAVWERSRADQGAVAMAVLVGLFVGYGGTTREQLSSLTFGEELFRTNSNFGLLQVFEGKRGDDRYYFNDYLTQNIYDPREQKSRALFTYMLHNLAHAYTPKIESVLCIGLGVGIVPMQFARQGVSVDVVEINPAVVPIATNFFNCDVRLLNVTIGDGRYFVNRGAKRSDQRYDAVILDAFLGDSSPSHLLTKQAFSAMRGVLRPNGTLVMNTFGDFEKGRDFMTASVDKTLRSVFTNVRIHAAGNGNVFFVASDRGPLEVLREPDFSLVHEHCRLGTQDAFVRIRTTIPEDGIILTDDFNPLEFHDAHMREEFRRQLAFRMLPSDARDQLRRRRGG